MTLPSQSAGREPVFNEDSLWREITGKWGVHGAHAEVYAMLLKDRDKLKGQLDELVSALEAALPLLLESGNAARGARAVLDKLKEAGS